jgi:hypothetical protein
MKRLSRKNFFLGSFFIFCFYFHEELCKIEMERFFDKTTLVSKSQMAYLVEKGSKLKRD